jgi:hypothetical protein
VSEIAWNTEAVMARYRELVSNPVREGNIHYNSLEASRIVRFESCGDIPDPRLSPLNVPAGAMSPQDVPTCSECGNPAEPRRSKCSACRKKAYRERSPR